MEASPNDNLTFRQAIKGKWQMPLFAFSIILFAAVLVLGKPAKPASDGFDQKLKSLELLSQKEDFQQFYINAEQLRLDLLEKDYDITEQFAKLRLLSASTRVLDVSTRQELSVKAKVGNTGNYSNIIKDYEYALDKGTVQEDSPELAKIYHDLALAYLKVKDYNKAMATIKRAIEVMPKFRSRYLRDNVEMNSIVKVEDYLKKNLTLLEEIMSNDKSDPDDKAWAFVTKANVLLQSDREKDALAWLDSMEDWVRNSSYGPEARYLRGKALRRDGQIDRADVELRQLLDELKDRGDVYAQTALELGNISYVQYRDYESRIFYRKVVDTQLGKDWYVAGKLGLAKCSALQQRYDESIANYTEVIEEYFKNPDNIAMAKQDLQDSLMIWADQLSTQRQYSLALKFLDLEQRIVDAKDHDAAYRYAMAHSRLANKLLTEFEIAQSEMSQNEDADQNQQEWENQQREIVAKHFSIAGQYFLKVADLSLNNDQLYSDSLWDSASSFDKAGDPKKAVEVWTRYVQNNEDKERWPRAVFYLAQAYQSMTDYGSAITQYGLLIEKYPMSPAAYDSVIPMAQCYLSRPESDGDEAQKNIDEAQKLLSSVLNNPVLTPRSQEYQQAMFVLGELYYKIEEYKMAINFLTEAISRYPDNPDLGKVMFLVADSYRRNGLSLNKELENMPANDPAAALTRDKIFAQRSQQLSQALEYFNQSVNFYAKIPESKYSKRDRLYSRLSWLHRADCLFDLGNYRQATDSYEDVISQFDKTPVALMAFVQLINCYVKLGQPDEASIALNKASWQLQAMTDETIATGPFDMTRPEWQKWFQWLKKSSLVN
ncbi:MAG: tetratricopeptide repeat protein [Phycisphaerae bacterium]|nr:tetratricopeptide repeat protein [Phycisphaerae bacterium]